MREVAAELGRRFIRLSDQAAVLKAAQAAALDAWRAADRFVGQLRSAADNYERGIRS